MFTELTLSIRQLVALDEVIRYRRRIAIERYSPKALRRKADGLHSQVVRYVRKLRRIDCTGGV